MHIIRLLRAPDGCPWDRAQTCESIKSNVIEEAYELADAIERGDDDGIEEETGDVMLQTAFHSVMKEEQGVFLRFRRDNTACEKTYFPPFAHFRQR